MGAPTRRMISEQEHGESNSTASSNSPGILWNACALAAGASPRTAPARPTPAATETARGSVGRHRCARDCGSKACSISATVSGGPPCHSAQAISGDMMAATVRSGALVASATRKASSTRRIQEAPRYKRARCMGLGSDFLVHISNFRRVGLAHCQPAAEDYQSVSHTTLPMRRSTTTATATARR